MNLENWVFERFGHEIPKPGLERVAHYLNTEKDFIHNQKIKVITIAGTNGKGETCFQLEKKIIAHGGSVTLWTSPHIKSLRERFRINGKLITNSELKRVLKATELLVQQENIPLTYYEFLFVSFMKWCAEIRPQIILLEVGLGGRLDAVNYFDADIVGLTSISRDHTEYLGETYKEILMEKLGVCRKQSSLFSSLELQYLRRCTKEAGKTVFWTDLFECGLLNKGHSFSQRNEALAQTIFNYLVGIKEEIKIPTRFENGRQIQMTIEERSFIFIGSHNLEGIRQLLKQLSSQQEETQVLFLALSKRKDKEIECILRLISESKLWGKVYLVNFDHPKALSLSIQAAKTFGFELLDSPERIIDEVKKRKEQKFLFSGSYYFLGEVLTLPYFS